MNKKIIGTSILNQVLGIKYQTGLNDQLLQKMQKSSDFFTEECKKIQPKSDKDLNQYNRTVLAKESLIYEGFEVVIIDWNEMNRHCHIHGHPQLMYYQVLSGTYIMNLYKVTSEEENRVTFERNIVLKEGDIYSSFSEKNGYSNAVHSIQCIRSGRTLNIYSGDGLKGERYKVKKPYPLKLKKI